MSSPGEYQGLDPVDPETAAEAEPAERLETSPPPPRRAVAAPPPPSGRPVRFEPLNLSRRPFLNTRPVVRVSLLLWALGLLLLLGNVSRYLAFRESSADKRAQIDRGNEEIMRQEQVSQRLQKQLDGFDLEQQNERVEYLNQKIQERTFSWSAVLDLVGQRMPNDVRLNRLSPSTERGERASQRRMAARRSGAADQVPLLITGEARNSEALDTFTSRLYQAPFDYPNLTRTEVQEDGLIRFELSVQYRPPGRPAAPGAPAGPAPRIEELPMPGGAGATATAVPPGAAATVAPPRGGRP
jgi:hypothetical protein